MMETTPTTTTNKTNNSSTSSSSNIIKFPSTKANVEEPLIGEITDLLTDITAVDEYFGTDYNEYEHTVTVDADLYNMLCEDSLFVTYLLDEGVNTWEGYNDVITRYMKDLEEEEEEGDSHE